MSKHFLMLVSLLTLQSLISCTKVMPIESSLSNKAESSLATVVSVEEALNTLNGFLSDVELTKANSGIERQILSIETHYHPTKKDAEGNSIPDAYLVNYAENEGFAILGANSEVDPIVAVVENGNTNWASIFNPAERVLSTFEQDCPDPGIKPDMLLSMCVRGALYGEIKGDDIPDTKAWTVEVLPLTTNQAFSQQISYCHKSNRGYVTNGCASTAISIVMAHNQYPVFNVDNEFLDYSECNTLDGIGYKYTFSDGEIIYLQLSDYFTNSSSIPTILSDSQIKGLLTQSDPGVINTHGDPIVSTLPNMNFYRTRYKLTSGVFYKLSNIIQSWAATGTMPAAVETGLRNLGYTNVSRLQKSSLTNNQILILIDMLSDGKPVIMCGWSLFNLSNSHYWVVDGIRHNSTTTHIHCNWGWGPSSKGWYSSTCIRPDYPVPTSASGNDWGNIIVYSYDMDTTVPLKSESYFCEHMPVQYE